MTTTDFDLPADKTCSRCGHPIPLGPISFIPGPPGEGGWACPPRLHDECEARRLAPGPDLGAAYGERMTRPHPLTADDEDMLRGLLGRDEIPPCSPDATLCGGTPTACWRHDAVDGACPRGAS